MLEWIKNFFWSPGQTREENISALCAKAGAFAVVLFLLNMGLSNNEQLVKYVPIDRDAPTPFPVQQAMGTLALLWHGLIKLGLFLGGLYLVDRFTDGSTLKTILAINKDSSPSERRDAAVLLSAVAIGLGLMW